MSDMLHTYVLILQNCFIRYIPPPEFFLGIRRIRKKDPREAEKNGIPKKPQKNVMLVINATKCKKKEGLQKNYDYVCLLSCTHPSI